VGRRGVFHDPEYNLEGIAPAGVIQDQALVEGVTVLEE